MSIINNEFTECLKKAAETEVKILEPMARHITFRAGGACDYYISPFNIKQVENIINVCKANDVPWYVIGNGSNLLVSDDGYHGVIIHIGPDFGEWEISEETGVVTVSAGASLGKMVRAVSKQGFGDLCFASGIPGSFGGAVVMNAGAYGGEIKQVLKEVTWLSEDGEIVTSDVSELNLSYRNSIFKNSKKVVLSGKLALERCNPDELMEKISEFNQKRREKQPLEYPSAGSTFKRPEGYFAGKLIEDCGLRGFQIGGAQVSEKHCGFVINKDNATASDLYKLFDHIKKSIKDKFDVDMELEVVLLGKF